MTGRVLHTSDWHLGRQISRHRRDGEFDAVLTEIAEIAAEFEPDLIVHSGDLFDGRPSLDDITRAAQALRRLGDIAPVVVIAGNHDTSQALRFSDFVLTDMGNRAGDQVRVRFAADSRTDGLSIFEYPARGELTLRIGALPYLHPNRFARDLADPAAATATYAERVRAVQTAAYRRLAAGRGPDDLLVFAAHLFVEGATPSYSERPVSIASDYAVAAADLPRVDYGALGHIHKPQLVERAGFPARYAGSPLQLDFGETGDTKSLVLAEIAPGKLPRIRLEPLTSGRPLVRLTGTLEEIARSAGRVGDAWVKAVVDAETPTAFLAETLAKLLPHATIVGIEERLPGAARQVLDSTAATAELPGIGELLREYLPARRGTAGRALEHVMATFSDLQAEPDPADPAPCCEETLLTAAIAGEGLAGIDRAGLLVGTEMPGAEDAR